MTPELFEELCLRALADRDPAAQAQVEELIVRDPALASQWRELQTTWSETRDTVADATALKTSGSAPIPAGRLAALMTPVKNSGQRARRVRWLGGLGFATAACLVALFLIKGPTPSRLDLDPSRLSPEARLAFFTPPLTQLSAGAKVITWRSTATPAIISPRLATAWSQPVLAWENTPGATYDVTLREIGGEIVFTRKAVRAPLDLGDTSPAVALAADKNYELSIRPAGGAPENTARSRFVTLPALLAAPRGATPQATLDALLTAMQSDPARLGDALILWSDLPIRWKKSGDGLRTGFWLAQEAQLPGLLSEVRAAADLLK